MPAITPTISSSSPRNEPAVVKAKLLAQIKHSLSITENDSAFSDVIELLGSTFKTRSSLARTMTLLHSFRGRLAHTTLIMPDLFWSGRALQRTHRSSWIRSTWANSAAKRRRTFRRRRRSGIERHHPRVAGRIRHSQRIQGVRVSSATASVPIFFPTGIPSSRGRFRPDGPQTRG